MIKKLYAIYDIAIQAYMNPYVLLSDDQAKRSFQEVCNDKDSNLARHPHDYTLHLVGHFDDHNGRMEPVDPPIRVAKASDYTNIPTPNLVDPIRDLKEA